MAPALTTPRSFTINGDRLKAARLSAGYTQREVAKGIGSHQGWISDLETGKGGGTPRMARRLAGFLRVTITDIADINI
jgi:transcriptional regulator with XRE-family HTH domain